MAFAVWPASDFTSDATTVVPAGLAGRAVDGGVEGQEVRLTGDIVDQLDDVADLLRRLGQDLDLVVGPAGILDRLARDPGGLHDLMADLGDRRVNSSTALATVCTLVEACSEAAATAVARRLLRRARHRLRGRLHVPGRRRQALRHAVDARLGRGHLAEDLLPFEFDAPFDLFLLGLQPLVADPLPTFQGTREFADLVLLAQGRDLGEEISARPAPRRG